MWAHVVALIALLPTLLQGLRAEPARDRGFWAALTLALAGAIAGILSVLTAGWHAGLAPTLWMTIAAVLTLYYVSALVDRHAWRLAPLVAGYMLALGSLALVFHRDVGPPLAGPGPIGAWVMVHVGAAVITYGLVTLAAIAALATFLQNRAIKRRRLTRLNRLLPSVADCEAIEVRWLAVGATVLAVGLLSGMAVQYEATGALPAFTHKTVFTLAAFVVIVGLLVCHAWLGVRGRVAARVVLLGYLLLTLGYPGVKLVTDILLP